MRTRMMIAAALLSTFSLVVCAAPETPAETGVDEALAPWSLTANVEAISAASCPDGADRFTALKALTITAAPVSLGPPDAAAAALPGGVTFAGGWHLTADDENFGGLSGLDIYEDGNLIAVSDAGAFVTLDMQDGKLTGSGSLSYMKGADGVLLAGKAEADAEGVIYDKGIALVSFEHTHRIMAFDMGTCGAAARGVEIASLPKRLGDQRIRPNSGAEAFAPDMNGYLAIGIETSAGGKAIRAKLLEDGSVADIEALPTRDGLKLVGSDMFGHVFRAYDPARGNRIDVRLTNREAPFRLERPLTVDNFEGIAMAPLPSAEGGVQTARLYLISDDNFSDRQRTLLFAFDVDMLVDDLH